MKIDRRTFLVSSSVVAGAVALSSDAAANLIAPPALQYDDPCYLHGDALTAHVVEPGLGGHSWELAREHALRHRLPDELLQRRLIEEDSANA